MNTYEINGSTPFCSIFCNGERITTNRFTKAQAARIIAEAEKEQSATMIDVCAAVIKAIKKLD